MIECQIKRQQQIIEVARKNARGELTPTQLDWWCVKLNTNIEELNNIYPHFCYILK